MINERVLQAALAGLLHDVGKFAQRAGIGLTETWDDEAKRDYGYQHALASYGYVKRFIPEKWREALSGVAYHHQPKNQADTWIQLADWLSSSEREQDEDNRIPRLQSVFSSLDGYDQARFFPLKRLNPAKKNDIFPETVKDTDWKAETQQAYFQLWQQFEQECKERQLIQADDQNVYLENLLALLQEFTWCIPSAFWQNVPDVSLYDHSRTTAAIAACLAFDQRSVEWCKKAKGGKEDICYLVGADLSGLQSFIYTIASSGAAKSLRARSFYVQMISDAIAYYAMASLGLPITNLLYVGGGCFQFLAPLGCASALQTLAQDIADRLLALHGGALGITLQWTKLSYGDFEKFNNARDRLMKNLNRAKRQPFAAATPEKVLEAVGQPLNQGGDPTKFCYVTGEDGPNLEEDQDGTFKSTFVLSLERLGRRLPDAKYILLNNTKATPAASASDWQNALRCFGLDVQIITDGDTVNGQLTGSEMTRIWQLSPALPVEETLTKIPHNQRVISYRPFARLTPRAADSGPKTFDELVKPLRGMFHRWGVLRMDVDNLGKLFQNGFGEKASLSRVASLSFTLRVFFEGWLPQLARPQPDDPLAKADLSEHIYIQYSGGDDVFVVGSWDALPEFARRIRYSLGQYACDNPAITISGGMVMADQGFPLYQAAEQAGEAESRAKSFTWSNGNKKDAFTFLETPLDWPTFVAAQQQADTLAQAINDGRLPRSLIQTILSLYAQVQQARRDERKPRFGPWTWMAAYQLTRIANQIRAEYEPEKELVLKFREKFLLPDTQTDVLGLSARWAQYLTRGG